MKIINHVVLACLATSSHARLLQRQKALASDQGAAPHDVLVTADIAEDSVPSSLEGYCAASHTESKDASSDASKYDQQNHGYYVAGQTVKANWMEFGVWYNAKITRANSDGTYNVIYDMDSMRERNVKPSMLQPRKTGPKNFDSSKDPACMMKNNVRQLNEDIDAAVTEAAKWIAVREHLIVEAKEHLLAPEEYRMAPSPAFPPPGVAPSPATSQDSPKYVEDAPKYVQDVLNEGIDNNGGLKVFIDCVMEVDNEMEIIKAKKYEFADFIDVELEDTIENAIARRQQIYERVEALKVAAKVENAAAKVLAKAKATIVASTSGKQALPPPAKDLEAVVRAEAEFKKARDNLMAQVGNLQDNLRDSKQKALMFETNVYPNGAKWWRFRYEYSYVEAIVMLNVIPLLILYKWLYRSFRKYKHVDAERHGWFGYELEEINGMLIAWIDFATSELFVCFCVVLTIWTLATFGCYNFLVLYVSDDEMHLPNDALQYRDMAIRLANQLGLAFLLYQTQIYFVVIATMKQFAMWETKTMMSSRTLGLEGETTSSFEEMRKYFMTSFSKFPQLEDAGRDMDGFPFAEYLSVSVRLYTVHIQELTIRFWFSVWATFGIFVVLHRSMHVAYIRIACFFASVCAIVLLRMSYLIWALGQRAKDWGTRGEHDEDVSTIRYMPREALVSFSLQYTLFFLCYCFVRMATSPWLWEIYFYTVLSLACIFIIGVVIFVVFFAPLVPMFYATMSLPPHITQEALCVITDAWKHKQKLLAEPLSGRRPSIKERLYDRIFG